MARGRIVAVLALGRGADARPFAAADLDDIVDFAAQTGIAIDNLRLHAREHSASVALQQALMTSPPVHAGLDIVSRYVAGESSQEVGGDWYDSFTESDGTAVAVIGDVVGHDIAAAAMMGQLRGIIRTIGYLQPGSPAGVLAAADRAAAGLDVRVLASALVARFVETPGAPSSHAVEWSSAGHPPPLLVRAGGAVEVLSRRNDLLLGIDPRVQRHDHTVAIGPGDTMVLYTDGLIERPDRDLDDGIANLAAALHPASAAPLDELCSAALQVRDDRTTDDVALLALRVRAG
jgi:serine phosphatase RsbU (regulator of sigma subunit)